MPPNTTTAGAAAARKGKEPTAEKPKPPPETTTKKKKKQKKPAAAGAAAKKTVLDKIVAAVRALRDPGPKGSSRQAIVKYLKSEFGYDNPGAVKKALQKGVAGKVLVRTGQSFRVAGDDPIPEEENEDEKLVIEDIKVPAGGDDDETGNDNDDDDEEKKKRASTATTAEVGDVVTVAYRGTLDDGYVFDEAPAFRFVLGAGEVIKGWDRGIVSMRVGGKRRLVVPSKLGYGKRGCKPDIPPNATLRFTVTLKGLKKGPPGG